MPFGKKLFTIILAAAALAMAGFTVWLYDHAIKPVTVEKIVIVEKLVPCPPANTGAATTRGSQSPAISGSGNTTTFGATQAQPPKAPPP